MPEPKLLREVVHPTIFNRRMVSDVRKRQLRVAKKGRKVLDRLYSYIHSEFPPASEADNLICDAIDALQALLKEIE